MRRRWKIVGWSGGALVGFVVFVIAALFGISALRELRQRGCPILAQVRPVSHTPIAVTDWIQLESSGGLRPHGETIRLYGDGRIERDTAVRFSDGRVLGCPLHEADKHERVPLEVARALLVKARDGGFCRLCNFYDDFRVSDGGRATITLQVGGTRHTVSSYAGKTPQLFGQLATTLRTLAGPLPSYANTSHADVPRQQYCEQFEEQQWKADETRRKAAGKAR